MLQSISSFASNNMQAIAYLIVFLVLVLILLFIYFRDKRRIKKVDYSNFPMSETEIALHRDDLQDTIATETQKIYCKNCGKPIQPQSIFCENCGQKTY